MTARSSHSNSPVWRSVGFWLALVMALLQGFYAFQALADPSAFAAYRGTPLAAAGDVHWVVTYASRTLFVALVVGLLLVRRDFATLQWVALLGIVMPISDALIASQNGASSAIVYRHVATVVYLLVTYVLLASWVKRHPTHSSLI